jgi:hypothetical protein
VVDAIPKIKPSGSFRGLEHRKLHAIGTAATVLSIFPIGRAAIFIRHITPVPVVMLQSITAAMAVCHILALDRAAASTGGGPRTGQTIECVFELEPAIGDHCLFLEIEKNSVDSTFPR